jgi:formylglycine-generating enzyme required for sulfatase activity
MLKKLNWFGLLVALLSSFIPSLKADTEVIPSLEVITNTVQIRWAAGPSNVFLLRATTNLTQPMQPQLPTLIATSNTAGVSLPIQSGARFFSVVKLDHEGPEIYNQRPADHAIANDPQAQIQVCLRDETGVDTNTIKLAIGTNAPMRLSDPRLAWSNGQLTYSPGTNGALGALGSRVTVCLSAADILGNWSSNFTWSFQLAMPTVLSTNLVFVGSGTSSGLTLVSSDKDTFTFLYAGTNSGLAAGMQLVNSDPANGYTRTVVSLAETSATKTVVVVTRIATLAELLQQGSMNSDTFVEVEPNGTIRRNSNHEVGIHLSYSYPLDETLYDDGVLTIETLATSHLSFDANLQLSANFERLKLRDFDVRWTKTVSYQVDACATATVARDYDGEKGLITPMHKYYVGFIGPVPVWVDVMFEINAGFTASWDATAEIQVGMTASKTIVTGRHWDESNGWVEISENPETSCAFTGPIWEAQGNGNLRVYLQPKVSVLVDSLAGVTGNVEPYLNLTGHAQANPYQWDMALYYGLDCSLGLNLSVWDKSWGEQPSKTFNLIPPTLLWQTNFPGDVPVITCEPEDQLVLAGATAVFSVQAGGGAPMEYQWMRNGVRLNDNEGIAGATNSTLTIRNASGFDSGSYSVRIVNQQGSANSRSVALRVLAPPPTNMAWIPPGSLQMGNCMSTEEGDEDELPVHTVYVDGFYMDRYLVTKALWDEVHAWAVEHGYDFLEDDFGRATNHPVVNVNWYDALKWCNARSEKEGRVPAYYVGDGYQNVLRTRELFQRNYWVMWNAGYRLPTEAEWEKAARGGISGKRFPWGDTISWGNANYFANVYDPIWNRGYIYDVNPKEGHHPDYVGGIVYSSSRFTSPVGAFAPNGYGLYDMAGNVFQWCWDLYDNKYSCGSTNQFNPRGPSLDERAGMESRVIRGGGWSSDARCCRTSSRDSAWAQSTWYNYPWLTSPGFRCVLPPEQSR